MGSPADLTLEVRPSTTTASSAFKSVFLGGDQLERMRRLEEYLKALEDERRKIEAFKRELPFCMQLLNDAIEASKEQLADFQPYLPRSRQDQVSCNFAEDSNLQSSSGRPMLEEFIPLKMKQDDLTKVDIVDDRQERRVQGNANVERANLMGLVQSWSPHSEIDEHGQAKASYMEKKNEQKESLQCDQEQAFSSSSKIFLHSTQRVGGAFLPFSREKRVIQPSPRSGTTNLPDLAFSSGDHEVSPHTGEESLINSARGRSREGIEQQGNEMVTRTNAAVVGVENNSSTAGAQSQRKARRCWSPELHRRFVNALQQLGGSQVATPKLIRELMKVEGLTNDEVKSHLQKYRLHTRRPSPAPQTSSPHAPQLVVLGGIWVPPEYAAHAAAAAQQSPAIYNHAQQPHLCQPSLPQDFYSQLNSSTQLQLHPSIYYDQQQAAAAHSQSSPQGPLQLAGQTSNGAHISGDVGREESVGEDGKSGSSSWKGEDQAGRLCEVEDNGDQRSYDGSEPLNVRLSQHSSDEDDPEFEDSRASEATLHF